ncbi:MAG: hypothetical protein ISR64_03275 [Deltaproteobacteria bacterium]|nr:hypothetical protein [Deltaproteobacteria bacterium]
MTAIEMSFDGSLLQRGFWLYVWTVQANDRTVLYVGRTGDSSSPNASSPFRRIGQHLDSRPNAKGNAMARQLKTEGVDPTKCRFEMLAFGPIFPEQETMAEHRVIRDRVAALERKLADHLKGRGHTVIGTHPRKRPLDEQTTELLDEVCRAVDKRLATPVEGRGRPS